MFIFCWQIILLILSIYFQKYEICKMGVRPLERNNLSWKIEPEKQTSDSIYLPWVLPHPTTIFIIKHVYYSHCSLLLKMLWRCVLWEIWKSVCQFRFLAIIFFLKIKPAPGYLIHPVHLHGPNNGCCTIKSYQIWTPEHVSAD